MTEDETKLKVQIENGQMCEHGNFKDKCPKCKSEYPKSLENQIMEDVEDRILSQDEFTQFRERHGFKNGFRGTFFNQDKSTYLYVKGAPFRASTSDVLQKKITILRHLTSLGALYPATRWGAYSKKDKDGEKFQIFGVTRALKTIRPDEELIANGVTFINRNAMEKLAPQKEDGMALEIQRLNLLFDTPGSHMVNWFRRVEPNFDPAHAPETALAGTLNYVEASHSDNWARDPENNFYPIDIEVIHLPDNAEELQKMYDEIQK